MTANVRFVVVGAGLEEDKLNKKAGAGICFPPEDSLRLVTAVESMMSMNPNQLAKLGEAGRTYYELELSLQAALPKYESVFREAIKS